MPHSTPTTLLVLAAGMASRYNGLKQLEPVGPQGQTILDYSLQAALEAGFEKVVFIVRDEIKQAISEWFEPRWREKMQIEFVCQPFEIPHPSTGELIPRTKPWGTAHAVLSAREHINGPFCVINADDFYGCEPYRLAIDFLKKEVATDTYALVGYVLKNTLSPTGTVSRGICGMDGHGMLQSIFEGRKIGRDGDAIVGEAHGKTISLDENSTVSMNFWMFHQGIFEDGLSAFEDFVNEHSDSPTAEQTLPDLIAVMMEKGLKVRVFPTTEHWVGLTYQEDKHLVKELLR